MVTIIDYGSGNLRSVQKALERVGVEARITADPNVVAESGRLVLPGVGAFGDAMRALRDRGLVEPILAHVRADKPFLGICMGLQLLFESGAEGGHHEGLGILPGSVTRFESVAGMKIPHMGWNQVSWSGQAGGAGCPLGRDGDHFYFVHSYVARPREEAVIAATSDYGGPFCAAVARGRLFATQFHPEKSQAAGMDLLRTLMRSP
ncbi:MAG: imidazole glycerol phosphate synthase subunit HisH [Planctomycetia bacterium]